MRDVEEEEENSINRSAANKLSIDVNITGDIINDMVIPSHQLPPSSDNNNSLNNLPPSADRIVRGKMTMRRTKRSPNERRFKCDQCERMFFTRKDVKRHLVVHTGVRNYACQFCQQRFGRKDHLVRHAKKSHQKDARISAATNLSASITNSPINRRISFPHSPHAISNTASSLTSPGCMIGNSNAANVSNNNNNHHHQSHSSCSYPSLITSTLDQPNSLNNNMLLLGAQTASSPVNSIGCNNGTNVSNSNNHHHDLCYPGNAQSHNGSMSTALNDGHFASSSMTHGAPPPPPPLCENSIFNNGGHYFSLGTPPSPFMNPAYITNCFGHLSVNPGNGNGQGLSVPTICSDQTSPVNYANPLPHYSVDVNLRDHLPHFNQVFQ